MSTLGKHWKVSEQGRKNLRIAALKRPKPSIETRQKLSEIHKGFKFSEESKQKMREKALKRPPFSAEHRRKMSEALKGRKNPEHSKRLTGRKLSDETRRKMSMVHKQRVLDGKNHFWKGGVTQINEKIRNSFEYKIWREAVFKRDLYTCIWCGKKNGNGKTIILNADHIKPFALFPELRFAIDNGRTLCKECHQTTDTYGRKTK